MYQLSWDRSSSFKINWQFLSKNIYIILSQKLPKVAYKFIIKSFLFTEFIVEYDRI